MGTRVAVAPERCWGVDMGTAGAKRCYKGGVGFRGPKLSSLLESTGWFCARPAPQVQRTPEQLRFKLLGPIYITGNFFSVTTVNVFSLGFSF